MRRLFPSLLTVSTILFILGFGGFGGGSQIWVLGVSAVGRGGWGPDLGLGVAAAWVLGCG
jgi:hypothetical protein